MTQEQEKELFNYFWGKWDLILTKEHTAEVYNIIKPKWIKISDDLPFDVDFILTDKSKEVYTGYKCSQYNEWYKTGQGRMTDDNHMTPTHYQLLPNHI